MAQSLLPYEVKQKIIWEWNAIKTLHVIWPGLKRKVMAKWNTIFKIWQSSMSSSCSLNACRVRHILHDIGWFHPWLYGLSIVFFFFVFFFTFRWIVLLHDYSFTQWSVSHRPEATSTWPGVLMFTFVVSNTFIIVTMPFVHTVKLYRRT